MPSNEKLAEGMDEYAKAIQKNAKLLQGNFEDINIPVLYAATMLEMEARSLKQAVEYAGDFDEEETIDLDI